MAKRPTVLTGVVYSDAWIVPGGKNYAATLLKDAGYHYLWQDDTSHGYLQLSFESVFEKGHDADLWIGVGRSLAKIEAADRRYTRFSHLRNGRSIRRTRGWGQRAERVSGAGIFTAGYCIERSDQDRTPGVAGGVGDLFS